MKYLNTASISLALALFAFAPAAPASAATSAATASLLAQVQQLKAQLQVLEQQLLLRGTTAAPTLPAPADCYTDQYGRVYCVTSAANTQVFAGRNDIDRIVVDFVGDFAQVRVEYDDDDTEFYAVEARTLADVARLLEPELRVSAATLLSLMDEISGNSRSSRNDNDDDIRDIDVDFDGNDADVVVRFDDGDTDQFTLRNVDRDEDDVIDELADRYDMDEDDIEDIIDFDNNGNNNNDDDIDSIDVDFRGDDADVIVRFEDGRTHRFTYRNVDDDEDEVIDLLADRYDMDEDVIEDMIDFD